VFGLPGGEYVCRSGIDRQHLNRIPGINYPDAKLNPQAQMCGWRFTAPGESLKAIEIGLAEGISPLCINPSGGGLIGGQIAIGAAS
jgi:hypothetical protein